MADVAGFRLNLIDYFVATPLILGCRDQRFGSEVIQLAEPCFGIGARLRIIIGHFDDFVRDATAAECIVEMSDGDAGCHQGPQDTKRSYGWNGNEESDANKTDANNPTEKGYCRTRADSEIA